MQFAPFGWLVIYGIIQWFINKYIFPVSQRVIDELESQFPFRGFVHDPTYGVVIMVMGIIGMIIHNYCLFC